MYAHDGQFSSLRFDIGKEFLIKKTHQFGLEFGGETGNTMRYDLPKDITESLGGLPFQLKLKPSLDLLLYNKFQLSNSHFFGMLKGGVALRTFQFERCSANDITQISPEFQLGIEYRTNPRYSIQLLYRQIIGKQVIYNFNSITNYLNITGIPTQYGVLLTTSIFLDNLGVL
jgi:hypothetical protein